MTILDTLTKRRNEIAAEIRALTDSLVHLDATIKLFAPEYQMPRQRGMTRKLFDTLREAGKPMSTRELAEQTGLDMKRIGITLNGQQKKGLVAATHRQDGCNVWEITQ